MLVSGVDQLVQALDDLFVHFSDYVTLAELKSLKLDMERTRLKKSIYRDFRRFEPEQAIDGEGTGDALCLAPEVIAVLGTDEREELIAGTQLQAS